jgi:hypothetical protein
MATVNFTVQGLVDYRVGGAEALVRALTDCGISGACFDPDLELFSVEIDPAVHSFADVRRTVSAVGKRKGLVYLAIVMSP